MKIRVIIACILMVFAASVSAFALEETVITRDENLVTLDRAIEIAGMNNSEIKQAAAEVRISEAKLAKARGQGGFAFNLTGNYVRTVGGSEVSIPMHYHDTVGLVNATSATTFQPLTYFPVSGKPVTMDIAVSSNEQEGVSFVAKKPIWTFGKIQNNVRLNKAGVLSSGLAEKSTRLSVALKVKQAYYQYLLATEFQKVAQDTYDQAKAHYDAAKARFDVGASPKFDLIRADVDVASAAEDLVTAKKGVNLARMALNNAMGIDVNAQTRVIRPTSSGDISLQTDQLVTIALGKRPDLKQLLVGQRQAQIGANLARLLPTIAFQGTYAFLNTGSAFSQQDTWQLVLAADVPLFDSGVAHADVSQAKRTLEKLKQTEVQARDGISLQVNEAFLGMKESGARKETSAAILAQAEEAVRMAEAGYKEGVTTNLDVIDAQHGLNGARLNNAQAWFDFELAKAKLLNAVGVESEDELSAAAQK